MIIVVMVGVAVFAVFALAALAGHFIWRQKKRKILLELEGISYTSVMLCAST